MQIEFDPEKSSRNIVSRGISFEDANRFEWDSALIIPDTRGDYGEPRYRAFGFIDRREVRRYETQIQARTDR